MRLWACCAARTSLGRSQTAKAPRPEKPPRAASAVPTVSGLFPNASGVAAALGPLLHRSELLAGHVGG
eukprot:8804009-Alexandrium_andersonii.AAC.1